MITGLAITNFKNLAQIPQAAGKLLPFGPLNVLIGPNGCGKSSLLQAIDFLRAFFHSSVEVYLKDREWDHHELPNLRQTKKLIRWELTATLDANDEGIGAGDYRYIVTLQPRRHLGVGEEYLEWAPPGQSSQVLLNRKGRRFQLYNRSKNEMRAFEAIGLPASVMSQLGESGDYDAYPEMLRFRQWIEIRIARDAFDHSLGEAWTSGILGATAGVNRP